MSSISFTARVAFRYLRALRNSNRIGYLRLLTAFCLLATIAIFLCDLWLVPLDQTNPTDKQLWFHQLLRYGKYGGVLATGLVGIFVELITRFTIFTTISTFGMFLGTGALVTIISFMSALQEDMEQKILGTHAHMTIEANNHPYISDYRETIEQVKKVPGVVAATPYLTMEMLAVNEEHRSYREGVFVRGVDATTLTQVTDLETRMIAGSVRNLLHPEQIDQASFSKNPTKQTNKQDSAMAALPRNPKLPGILVGKELALNLSLYEKQELPLGSEIILASPVGDIGPNGSMPSIHRFQIVGIFYTGMYEYDSKYVYIQLPKLQRFLNLEDEVSGIELKLKNPDFSELWLPTVSQVLNQGNQTPQYRVEDWKTRNQSLISSLKLEKIVMFLGLCLIILVAASSVISNGLMLVAEKTQEIAMLKSMGATDVGVLSIFTGLGLTVGVLGIGLGVIGGLLTCHLLSLYGLPISDDVYYVTKVLIVVNPKEVLLICGAALLLVLAATIYPAYTAARMRPVDGLR